MKSPCSLVLMATVTCGLVSADEVVAFPKDIPPVIGTAIASNDPVTWTVQLTIPRIAWKIVGERQPKTQWPELQVKVEEAILKLSMGYHPAAQLSEESQNRLVDLKGRRLKLHEAVERLKEKAPVLVSLSGRVPDAYYLQCMKPDTLIVILGIPESPAPQLLPHEEANDAPTN